MIRPLDRFRQQYGVNLRLESARAILDPNCRHAPSPFASAAPSANESLTGQEMERENPSSRPTRDKAKGSGPIRDRPIPAPWSRLLHLNQYLPPTCRPAPSATDD